MISGVILTSFGMCIHPGFFDSGGGFAIGGSAVPTFDVDLYTAAERLVQERSVNINGSRVSMSFDYSERPSLRVTRRDDQDTWPAAEGIEFGR